LQIPSLLRVRNLRKHFQTDFENDSVAGTPRIRLDRASATMSYIRNIKVFVRAYELGSMSAAGRDQRVSAAVVSSRIIELEKHLGVRLFHRTTRKLTPTEHGAVFYSGAVKILDVIQETEAAVAEITGNPRGTIYVAAPLGIGRRLIAPLIPEFKQAYPDIVVRLRLSDRKVDMTGEGLDVAFFLGTLEDSDLRLRTVMTCERVFCAAPAYLDARGTPETADDLVGPRHSCLLLRYPGSNEFFWTVKTPEGPKKLIVSGPFESDDGDVLTDWALTGHGIVNKPQFEMKHHLDSGRLKVVCPKTPPIPSELVCLYPHKRYQDPKSRLFIDFMAQRCRAQVAALLGGGNRKKSVETTRKPSTAPSTATVGGVAKRRKK
jgi:DNA-binding transcriptional LysR family regulator